MNGSRSSDPWLGPNNWVPISVISPDTTKNNDIFSINKIVFKPLVVHNLMVSIYNQVAFKLQQILFETRDFMTSIKSIDIIYLLLSNWYYIILDVKAVFSIFGNRSLRVFQLWYLYLFQLWYLIAVQVNLIGQLIIIIHYLEQQIMVTVWQ